MVERAKNKHRTMFDIKKKDYIFQDLKEFNVSIPPLPSNLLKVIEAQAWCNGGLYKDIYILKKTGYYRRVISNWVGNLLNKIFWTLIK